MKTLTSVLNLETLSVRSCGSIWRIMAKQEGHERVTRAAPFTIEEAKHEADLYTDLLWKAIRKRLEYTDMSQSPCAYSEAPAEGIFSVYSRVSKGRESATVDHLVALSRVAVHGPPSSTAEAATLAEEAMNNYPSQHGERFCSKLWMRGKTSTTVTKLKNKKWNW